MIRPHWKKIIFAIGRVTFSEIVRDKLLYNIALFTILLLGMGLLASRLTFIRPERVVLDFGLSAVSLSGVMIALFCGAGMLGREFERRTALVALSRPISRMHFVLGKYAGLAGVLVINWLMLSGALIFILGMTGSGLKDFHSTLFIALGLSLLQSLMMASLTIAISSFSTASISVIIGIGLYLVGNNISQIRVVASRLKSPWSSGAFEGLAAVLPNLEHFNLGTQVTYGLKISPFFVAVSFAYAVAVSGFALFCAGLLLKRRET